MKCTDFWQKERDLKKTAIEELDNALKAHKGRYSWCDDDGEIPEGVETPCICVFLDNVGPTDVNIKEVIHDKRGWWFSCEETEYGNDIEFQDPYDISCAFQIQAITELIPETKKVKSAEEVVPQTVSLLDREDLKQRGFDGSKLTNKELAEIAAKMNDYYLDYGFWDDMQEACIQLGIPRLKEKEK